MTTSKPTVVLNTGGEPVLTETEGVSAPARPGASDAGPAVVAAAQLGSSVLTSTESGGVRGPLGPITRQAKGKTGGPAKARRTAGQPMLKLTVAEPRDQAKLIELSSEEDEPPVKEKGKGKELLSAPSPVVITPSTTTTGAIELSRVDQAVAALASEEQDALDFRQYQLMRRREEARASNEQAAEMRAKAQEAQKAALQQTRRLAQEEQRVALQLAEEKETALLLQEHAKREAELITVNLPNYDAYLDRGQEVIAVTAHGIIEEVKQQLKHRATTSADRIEIDVRSPSPDRIPCPDSSIDFESETEEQRDAMERSLRRMERVSIEGSPPRFPYTREGAADRCSFEEDLTRKRKSRDKGKGRPENAEILNEAAEQIRILMGRVQELEEREERAKRTRFEKMNPSNPPRHTPKPKLESGRRVTDDDARVAAKERRGRVDDYLPGKGAAYKTVPLWKDEKYEIGGNWGPHRIKVQRFLSEMPGLTDAQRARYVVSSLSESALGLATTYRRVGQAQSAEGYLEAMDLMNDEYRSNVSNERGSYQAQLQAVVRADYPRLIDYLAALHLLIIEFLDGFPEGAVDQQHLERLYDDAFITTSRHLTSSELEAYEELKLDWDRDESLMLDGDNKFVSYMRHIAVRTKKGPSRRAASKAATTVGSKGLNILTLEKTDKEEAKRAKARSSGTCYKDPNCKGTTCRYSHPLRDKERDKDEARKPSASGLSAAEKEKVERADRRKDQACYKGKDCKRKDCPYNHV